jgi:sporulation protein YlmC with PRC-barrel domain
MIRASELLGCVVRTESGKKLGRVHDLRAKTTNGSCVLAALIVGRAGMFARFTGGGTRGKHTHGGNLVPWQSITHLADGQITVRD